MKLNRLMIAVVTAGIVMVLLVVGTRMKRGGQVEGNSGSVGESGARRDALPAARDDARPPTGVGADEAHTAAAVPKDKALIRISLPKPVFEGTPKEIKGAFNLEPPRGKPYPAIMVPIGCDKLLSRDCKVTSSDPDPIIGELSYITDGDKEYDAATYVELGPGVQWVQVDLGEEREIYAACVWHNHYEARVYRDVICRISNDPDFIDGVVTVFNNDHDNSAKLGAGTDKEYIETHEGRPFPIHAVKGRYARFYSRGNTSNELNHYTEIEIYGREVQDKALETEEEIPIKIQNPKPDFD